MNAGDFGAVLSRVRAGDFVYLDPPYAVESRRVFREYDKRDFTTRDLGRIADHLDAIDAKGAAFVLSYADCKEARDSFGRWRLRRIRVRRNIAGFAAARRTAVELLATNIERES
jgi:DNA adenine methylase